MVEVRDDAPVYVWYWLPGATEPVCAGQLSPTKYQQDGDQVLTFAYAPEYLARPDAIPLLLPDLPLTGPAPSGLAPSGPAPSGPAPLNRALKDSAANNLPPGNIVFDPRFPFPGRDAVGLTGALRDAAPDQWGRWVVNAVANVPPETVLPETEYLLAASGTNRIGALDFQPSPEQFSAVDDDCSLDQLLELTRLVFAGQPIPAELMPAVRAAAGVGGARPKALWRDGDRQLLVKFEMPDDQRPMVQMEAVSMLLAPHAGIPAETGVEIIEVPHALYAPAYAVDHWRHDDGSAKVMLIERFDRPGDGTRRQLVSLRTAVGLGELGGQKTSYPWIAEAIRRGPWADVPGTLSQIFRRLVFSIQVSNKDDHLRNTATFWDGKQLTLTPAFDIAPQARMTVESNQFPAITRDGQRASQLRLCRLAAPEFGLTTAQADHIIEEVTAGIIDSWDDACDRARLTQAQRDDLYGREFLNPYARRDTA